MPETEKAKREHRCCFTGHRPEKLRLGEQEIRRALLDEIEAALSDGYTVFVCGMARGVDLWAGEMILSLRETRPDIKLICAVPYDGVEHRWSPEWQQRFWAVRQAADYVQIVSPSYHRGVFAQRNRWMVDHCRRIIAVYNGAQGGTADTLRYAIRQKCEARCIIG